MLTSIILPSRGRPEMLHRMIATATATAAGQLEILVALHHDDPAKDRYNRAEANFREFTSAPTTWMWNERGMEATGDVLVMAADDFSFMTKHWDAKLRENAPLDDVWVANFGQAQGSKSCGNGIAIPRKVRDCLGYFNAYWFHHWCSDKWMTDIAQLIGRYRPMHEIWIQHAKMNDATRQSMARPGWVHARDVKIFERSLMWREAEARKLKAAMVALSD